MELLDGNFIASQIKLEITEQVKLLETSGKTAPHLVAILVGDNASSASYVRNKIKFCEEVGFKSSLIRLPIDCTESELLENIQKLNADPLVDGYIVQLPLPKHIDENKIIMTIDPSKDVDGFHPTNFGKMAQGLPAFLPATPAGIIQILKRSNIQTVGKHCVIIGRSNIVGMPMSILMAQKGIDCTVTLTHSKTQNLKDITLTADILIAAIGIPHFVTADMIKPNAVVIDVGINQVDDATRKSGYRLVGDVNFEQVAPIAGQITPVPGGVGPMTVAALMLNTLQAKLK
jgi:methylenetetrahydrofolate dehydrogenase (NADP+)/methenyltetrahydrofolate cyclohydrolase